MDGGPGRAHGKKIQATITVDPELHAWVMRRIDEDAAFANLSHAVERGLRLLKRAEEMTAALRADAERMALEVEEMDAAAAAKKRRGPGEKDAPGRVRGSTSKSR